MKERSRMQSFFLEMAAVILFFSLAAAIDLRLFGAGETLSRESQDLNSAVLTAQGLAERIAAGEFLPRETALVYYREDWTESGQPDCFQAEIEPSWEETGAGTLARYVIRIRTEEGAELFSLDAAKYLPEGGSSREE